MDIFSRLHCLRYIQYSVISTFRICSHGVNHFQFCFSKLIHFVCWFNKVRVVAWKRLLLLLVWFELIELKVCFGCAGLYIDAFSCVGNVLSYPEAVSPHMAYFGHYVHSDNTGLRCALTNQLKTCREGTNQASSVVLLFTSVKVMLGHPATALMGICSTHVPVHC